MVQWFGLHAFTAEGPGSNHSWGTKIAQAAQPAKKKKKSLALKKFKGFPGGAVVKNPPANAGDMGSSPGPGRSRMPRSN